MQQQRTKTDFTDQPIYVGIDVHKKSWRVSIFSDQIHHKTFTQSPNAAALVSYLHRTFPGARVRCAYEAGFSGISAARTLRAHGMECLVVHPPDIPRTEHDRLRKNDKIDARRLARELRTGSLRSIYLPTAEAVEHRSLVRMRQTFVKKQTRCKAQVRMFLHQHGIEIPLEFHRSWSRRFLAWVRAVEYQTSSAPRAMEQLLCEYDSIRTQLRDLDGQIRELSEQEPYRESVALLLTVPGIGLTTAMILLTEIIDIFRFPTADHLANYVGVAPGEHSSGDRHRQTGITQRRNGFLRHKLIESAWVAVQHDPALMQVYENAAQRMAKTKAIVLVARRLLNRIRAVLVTGTPYQCGCRQVVWHKDEGVRDTPVVV